MNENNEPKIVALLCNWCSYAGADLAGVSRFQYPPTIRVIRVMCSTRIEPSFVLYSFLRGADGVLVGGCHLGDCHYVTGNYYTIGKIHMAKRLLTFAGIDERRLRLEWVSASEGERFAQVVTEFTEELKKAGPLNEEERNSLALRAAYNSSLKPRIRILATKERMLAEEGNKYGEYYTPYEFNKVLDEIVYDELNEEKIRLLLQTQHHTLGDIATLLNIPKEIVFLYLIDFVHRKEASFSEKNGVYSFSYQEPEKVKPAEHNTTKQVESGEGIVVIGAGAYGITQAVLHAEKGEHVFVVETHPTVSPLTVRKHDSTLKNGEIPLDAFRKLVQEEKISLVTNAWVRMLDKGTVRVVQYPSRVNGQCTNFDECGDVCPLKIIDREQTLFSRKAIYERDGTPSMYLLEKETPFCQTNCPAHVDVRGYVARIAEGRFEDALNLIRERLPLPAVLGRVCPNPCEELCRRNGFEEAISIRLLKRFVADWEFSERKRINLATPPANENSKRNIAIIGSGPAGLTAAYDLARKGYKVTIYESLPVPGGMLAVGIPSYRLPKDVLNREINAIVNMGIDLKLDTTVGKDLSFDNLKKSHDAVFVAVGAHGSRRLGVEGENLKGVISGVEFLREVNLSPETVRSLFQDRTIAIIGGGDVAIDAARCAVRLGCKEVIIIYRRGRAEMPAREEEIEFAESEGVTMKFMAAPVKVHGNKEHVTAVECIGMELGEPDASGRRRPVPKQNSEFKIEVDMVIAAIGQYPEFPFLPEDIKRTSWGIAVDEKTAMTSVPGVFAGGDAVTGPWIAIGAVAWGRRAAHGIDAYIHGKEVVFDPVEQDVNHAVASWEDVELMKRNVVLSGLQKEERKHIGHIRMDERLTTFNEVETNYDQKTAVAEAQRCLSCRECLGCGICGNECKENAIAYEEGEREIELSAHKIILDPEIYFTVESGSFTPFELEDMLNLGIVMDIKGEKPKSVAFINQDSEHQYINRLKQRLEANGITLASDKVKADMLVNCQRHEYEYYKKIAKNL